MSGKRANSQVLRTILTAIVCGVLAGLLSLLLGDSHTRLVVPLLFLLSLVPLSALLGKVTAIIGSVVATLTFTLLLFPPLYSFRVNNFEDKVALITFQALAIVLAYLSDIQLTD